MVSFKIRLVLGDYDPDGPGPLEWHGLWFRDENDVALSYDDRRVKRAGIEIFKVAGVSHREQNLQNADFSPGRQLTLIPEPNNPYDKNAVGVWNATRRLQIGYVPKESAAKIARRLRFGEDLQSLSLAEWLKDGRRVGLRVAVAPGGVFQIRPSV